MNFIFVKIIRKYKLSGKLWLKFINRPHWGPRTSLKCTESRVLTIFIFFFFTNQQIHFFFLIHSILIKCSNNIEVTVVYFRAGYEPGHYPSQNEWDARFLIEKSAAIKCPSIQYHLAGTKKVQQALAKPGILKRFLTDDAKIKAITNTFTGLYSMDNNTDDGQEALRMVLTDPAKWVKLYMQLQSSMTNFNCFADTCWNHSVKVEETTYMAMTL